MPIQFLNIQQERKITGLRHYSFYVPNNEKHAEKCNIYYNHKTAEISECHVTSISLSHYST